MTAAQLADQETGERERVSPDVFAQGMAVTHPEYGLGKIVALAGRGLRRRATVAFATAGEKKFVVASSALRPAPAAVADTLVDLALLDVGRPQ